MTKWLVVLSDGTFEELDAGQFLVEMEAEKADELDGDFPEVPDCSDLEKKVPGVLIHIHLQDLLFKAEGRN